MKNQSTFRRVGAKFFNMVVKNAFNMSWGAFALKFLNKFFVISGIVSKNFQHCCQNCSSRACKKTLGEKSFEKRSQLKELCFWLWPRNVQSLVKTALYVSKRIFCHLRLKNLYSLETFPDFEQKAMEINEFFFWRILKTELYVPRGRFIRVKAY